MWSGSSTGTLYFRSPAELPYVSAITKTYILFTHQLTCYQTGCHLLTYSPSVVATHLTVSTNCHQYRGRLLMEREILHICVTAVCILNPYTFFRLMIVVSLEHAVTIFRVQVTAVWPP
jgi:hypothetical protein